MGVTLAVRSITLFAAAESGGAVARRSHAPREPLSGVILIDSSNPPRVLVHSNDPQLLRLLQLYLSRERPYAFTFESDPAAALRCIDAGGLQVLVTDDGADGLGGREHARRARAADATVRTVVMTGTRPPRIGPGNVDAWLIKPFYVPALLNLIDGLLLSHACSSASGAPPG